MTFHGGYLSLVVIELHLIVLRKVSPHRRSQRDRREEGDGGEDER